MAEKNYSYIDFIRVFSIIMVITLHCICDYYANTANAGRALWYTLGYVNELARVGVPLFFMISGFLLLSRDITNVWEFYKKRILKVGIPFIIYDILYYVYMSAASGKTITVQRFFAELLNSGSAYHLWFVYSIIFIYLLMPFLQMIVKSCSRKMLMLFFVLTIFQTGIRPFINTAFGGSVYIFLTDDGFVGYIGYVILGYILGTYDFGKGARRAIMALSALFFILTPIISMSSAARTGEFLFIGGYSINHYIEAAGVFIWCKTHFRKSNRLVSYLSGASFGAYLIHVLVLEIIKPVSLPLPPSVVMLIWLAVTLVLSFAWGGIEKCLTALLRGIIKPIKRVML